ncbi:cytochrome P450 family protein [Dictyostelium discoideum AX4]|uniref:Putative cytochrome P450 520B1 n=1 Tax=Dictyostelium discoideum TaxID=44689 RepID=C520B_DICDI|nr:cytochrome P450 family protein [Dictyostelium discoideum AX4]Q54E98.1 PUTATIVE PSEUDOGENE: RecName: Full=Putative cytochrome P450 520B1 [Dictyostelium discoideum]EAL61587.1 cytochrome P450 family protein [Dictyostelium discoideum AX4]|eukprot:XP_630004.1 cytochrome P450 family protein [Dictyostelium discoideum AX4]
MTNNKLLFKKDVNGPWSLPIIGGIYLINDNPNRALTKLSKKYGGIYKIWLGESFSMVVSDPEIVNEIWVKQHDNFINRPKNITHKMFSSNYRSLNFGDNPNWKFNRSMASSHFTKTKLLSSKVTSVVEKKLNKLIETMEYHSINKLPFDSYVGFSEYSLNIILNMLVSMDIDECENSTQNVIYSINEIFKMLSTNSPQYSFPYLKFFFKKDLNNFKFHLDKIKSFIHSIYLKQLESYDPSNPRNILDSFISDLQSNDIDILLQICIDIVVAGTDTVANLLQWFVLFCINYPEIQEKLYNEIIEVVGKDCKVLKYEHISKMPYLYGCFRESLRIRPVTPLSLPRVAKCDTYIKDDIFIPKGATIIQNIFGMGNDEKYISEPNKFKPERWVEYIKNKKVNKNGNENSVNKYFNDLDKISIPFGVGKRQCLSPAMAEQESLLSIATVVLNYKLKSNGQKKLNEKEVYSITIKPQPFKLFLEKRV